MIKHHVMSILVLLHYCLSPKTHQNIANFTHTTCRLVNHVALFAIRINRTMNQRKEGKKEIRVYKTGYWYLQLVTCTYPVPNSSQ